jgi:cytochrome oxidase Cu insertion factor (SCO1/SenC/PrrC family)
MSRILFLVIGILVLLLPATTCLADGENRPFDAMEAGFELTNAQGERVTEQDIRGRYVLLAFGFTHCLHICPMMAANMAMALKASQQDALGIFISVDTERDTPAVTQAYASSFHESMIGLGGSYQQISEAANNFKVSFVVNKSQKAYTVEHTSDIFLIGPQGKILEVFALNASPKTMAAAIDSRSK